MYLRQRRVEQQTAPAKWEIYVKDIDSFKEN